MFTKHLITFLQVQQRAAVLHRERQGVVASIQSLANRREAIEGELLAMARAAAVAGEQVS